MNYISEYIRAQLAKYITKYMDAVQVVAGDFLKAKGLTVEDYLLHISQPGNRADELAIYLVSRFCQKYIAVITKDTVWFTRRDTSIEDCPIVLVYLGGGTFHDTKSKVGKCFRQLPTPMEHEESDSDFVYDPESPWGPMCHADTPGPWVLHHPNCHHQGRSILLSQVNLKTPLQSQNPGDPGS